MRKREMRAYCDETEEGNAAVGTVGQLRWVIVQKRRGGSGMGGGGGGWGGGGGGEWGGGRVGDVGKGSEEGREEGGRQIHNFFNT